VYERGAVTQVVKGAGLYANYDYVRGAVCAEQTRSVQLNQRA